jgi:hypothetical protein
MKAMLWVVRRLERCAGIVYWPLNCWREELETAAWSRAARQRFPIATLALCRCDRCKGMHWRVAGYDDEMKDLRLVDPSYTGTWPPPGATRYTWAKLDTLEPVR